MYLVKRATIWLVGFLAPGMAVAQISVFQPGYVIRAEAPADTIRGYVDTFFAVEKKGVIMFRTTQDAATAQTFTAAQLTAAGTGTQEVYVTRQIPIGDSLQPRFLQVVVSGEASLFKTQSSEQQARYFVERRGGQTMPLRRGQHLQVLQNVLAGCTALSTDIAANHARYSYQPDDLQRAVRQYNACTASSQPEQVYSGSPKPGKPLGVRVGVQSSQIYYPKIQGGLAGKRPDAQLSPVAGIFWKLNLSSRFAFVPELRYGRSEGSVSVVERPGASNDYYRVGMDLRASYVQLPLLLRYTFGRPGRLIRPYLEGGYVAGAVFNSTSQYSLTAVGTVGVDKTSTDTYEVERTLRGYSGGGGLDFYSPIGIWGLSVRIDALSLNSSYVDQYIYVDNQSLTLTYTWR